MKGEQMKLYFIGADHEVTGSCHVVEVNGKFVMLDCGLEQGRDIYVNEDLPVKPEKIDAVLLSHAHIDHSGLLPWLVKEGFRGEIWCTEVTRQLCDVMLKDSAHIQETEVEWSNRKAKRSGKKQKQPLYTVKDAEKAMRFFRSVNYGETFALTGDLGNTGMPIVSDPSPRSTTDYVITESTYGDRLHEKTDDPLSQLTSIMKRTFDRGGNVVIPAFAVGMS